MTERERFEAWISQYSPSLPLYFDEESGFWDSACGGSLASLDPDQIEVIGNIHENLNLLELQDD